MQRHRSYYYQRNLLLACAGLGFLGCAGPNRVARDARRFDFAQLDAERSPEVVRQLGRPPYIVRFEKGRTILVDFALDSKLFAVQDEDFTVVAKRDFYVLFREDGPPLLSEDGVEFEDRPRNFFCFGFRMRAKQPTTIDFALGRAATVGWLEEQMIAPAIDRAPPPVVCGFEELETPSC